MVGVVRKYMADCMEIVVDTKMSYDEKHSAMQEMFGARMAELDRASERLSESAYKQIECDLYTVRNTTHRVLFDAYDIAFTK